MPGKGCARSTRSSPTTAPELLESSDKGGAPQHPLPSFLQPKIFDERKEGQQELHPKLKQELRGELAELLEKAELKELLEDPALVEIHRRYADKNRTAKAEKARFVRFSQRASLSILVGTVAAALLVSSASLSDPAGGAESGQLLSIVRWLLVVGTVGAGSYALFCLTFLNRAGLLQHFREARSRAELERLSYFTKLAELAPSGSPAAPVALETFRLCQLEGQRLFFLDRIETARARYQRTVWIGSISVVIVAFGGGGFGVAGVFEPRLLPLAGLGAIGAALATYSSQLEALNQDERTGTRYGKTVEALSKLMERFAEVRRGVRAGSPGVFSEFVAAVQEQLAVEHQEWVEDSKALDRAVEALDASLRKLRDPQASDETSDDEEES